MSSTPPQPITLSTPRSGSGDVSTQQQQQQQRVGTPPVALDSVRSPNAKVKPLNPAALAHDVTPPSQSLNPGAALWTAAGDDMPHAPVPQPFPISPGEAHWSSQQHQQHQQQHSTPLRPPVGPIVVGGPVPPPLFPPQFSHPAGGGLGVSEAEFAHARAMIPHVQRPALVAVLQSLIDDFPNLAPIVRVRCEKAMAVLVNHSPPPQGMLHHPQQHHHHHHHNHLALPGSMAHVGPHVGTQQVGMLPQPWVGGGGPMAAGGGDVGMGMNLLTPPKMPAVSVTGRRGSNPRGTMEEQGLCGIHGNVRAAKHLKYNPAARQHECIPGFHCLENSREASAVPSPMVASSSATPTKKEERQDRLTANGTPPPGVPYLQTNVGPAAAAASGASADPIDVAKLESLLQDLRRHQTP